LKDKVGVIVNRLVYGFTFAFLYQIVIGIATSVLSLPLTGNIQDLISGVEQIESQQGPLLVAWWIISTIIITAISLIIIRYRKFLSPYKGEKDIEIPPKITAITAIIIGAIISFLFFLLDITTGAVIESGSRTDVHAIYQAAIIGDFVPLLLSIVFSIAAGFIVVGVASKTAKVREITKDIGIRHLTDFSKLIHKKNGTTTTADTIGLRPGALVHVGKKKVEKIKFDIIEFDQENFDEYKNVTIDDCLKTKEKPNVSWIKISGIHDPDVIQNFGKYFGIHSLIQADIMNTELRPKFEVHADHIFMILKIPHINEKIGKLIIEQISIVLGKNFVLTFQETEEDIFDPIRKRIKEAIGDIRKQKSDYLTYTVVDTIVDSFFGIMERVGDATERLEEELMKKPEPKTLETIHALKRQMILLRKSIWPIRDVIDSFERAQSPLIESTTKPFVRDVYSHAVQVMDTVEALREMVGGMLDTYLSSLSNKMNEIMKMLTIIASIFIPITFIAGIYGTNFEYIPELAWKGSYFTMLGVMIIIVLAMMIWFKKKQWL